MKAVLLAAGTSSRLRPYTDSTPKCLLSVGDEPILLRALRTLARAGVRQVAIVTGYRERQIRAALERWDHGCAIEIVSNAAYATTNNCVSLLLAERAVGDDEMLLVDGDLVFDDLALATVLRAPHRDVFALRLADELGDEEMKAELDADLRLRALSKALPIERAAGESVGMFRFGSAREVFARLRHRVVDRGLVDEWYEAAFQDALDEGLVMHAAPIPPAAYVSEIDTPDDLARVDADLRRGASPRSSEAQVIGAGYANDRARLRGARPERVRRVEGDLMLCFDDDRYDGALMVHPGPHLPSRTADGHLATTLADTRAVAKSAARVEAPDLRTFLEDLVEHDLSAIVESKIPGTFARVAASLRPHASRLVLASFDGHEIGAATAAGLRSGCILKHRATPLALDALRTAYGFRTLLVDAWTLERDTVAWCRSRGIELLAYQVEEGDRAARSLALGVDGLVTPKPGRLLSA
jgi:choline kinase